MKKRNLILTAVLFAVTASLATCGGRKPAMTQPAVATATETKSEDQKEEPKEDRKPEETAIASAKRTRYEKTLESDVLEVSTKGTHKPFTYHDDNNELCGHDVEVAGAIDEKMGVKTEFSEITQEGLLTSLDTGTVDLVLNQVDVTNERKAKYDFSAPYLYSYITLITKTGNNDITDWDNVNGKKTSLNVSSNYVLIAKKYNMDTTTSDTFSKDIELLLAGRTDCVVDNTVTFNDFLMQKPDTPTRTAAALEQVDTVAVPIPQGNDNLVEAVNKAVAELKADGTLTELSNKHLGRDFSRKLTLEKIQQQYIRRVNEMDTRSIEILISSFWSILRAGISSTTPLTLISFALGTTLTIFVAVIRISKVLVLSKICELYVWIIRGTPLFVQLLLVFFGLPKIGVVINPMPSGILVFALNIGAYSSEVTRTAILSIPKGQREAAVSLGMSYPQQLLKITLPQTFKMSVPSPFNSFIALVKDIFPTANITAPEMFSTTQGIAARNYEPLLAYIEVGFIYLIFRMVLNYVQNRMENKLMLTPMDRKEIKEITDMQVQGGTMCCR